jgi:hypothetical protein
MDRSCVHVCKYASMQVKFEMSDISLMDDLVFQIVNYSAIAKLPNHKFNKGVGYDFPEKSKDRASSKSSI